VIVLGRRGWFVGEVEVEVVEALVGGLVQAVRVGGTEGVIALGEQNDLLLAREVLLAHLVGQRKEESSLGLGDLPAGSAAVEEI
jgi:hypothetical protein